MAPNPGQKVQTYGPKTGPCSVCGKADALACGRCLVDFYCGKEHQTQDWPRHRRGCGAFEEQWSEELGRHLVATKAIPAGTLLMREYPLIAFPQAHRQQHLRACVACLQHEKPLQGCARCGWPVCDERCSLRKEHVPECAVFQRANFKLGSIQKLEGRALAGLMTLRVYLALTEGPHKDRLQRLQSRLPDYEDMVKYAGQFGPDLLVHRTAFEQALGSGEDWLTDVAGISWLPINGPRAAYMMWAINYLDSSKDGSAGLYVFAGMSMVEHACLANSCVMAWEPEVEVPGQSAADLSHVLVAARDIAPGEHISRTCRGNVAQGSRERRTELMREMGFVCNCTLCQDPTDRGLHLDGWCCGKCSAKKRKAFPVTVCSTLEWRCDGCGQTGLALPGFDGGEPEQGKANALKERANTIMSEQRFNILKPTKVQISKWESFLSDALWPRGPLHATHHLVARAKTQIVCMLFDAADVLKSMQEADLDRVLGYCRDLMDFAKVLRPSSLPHRRYLLMRWEMFLMTLLSKVMNRGNRAKAVKLLTELRDLQDEYASTCITPKQKKEAEQRMAMYNKFQ